MELARAYNGEIVSCDSVQVYRGFDVGSAKPSQAERQEVPHHMIDLVSWHEAYDAGTYGEAARHVLQSIKGRGKLPIVVGGTGLYLRALWSDRWHKDLPKDEALRVDLGKQDPNDLYQRLSHVDPGRAAHIHPHDTFRVIRALEIVLLTGQPVPFGRPESRGVGEGAFVIKLDPPKALLADRIAERTRTMVEGGLIEEAESLLRAGCPRSAKPMQSIGYREAAQYLDGGIGRQDLEEQINQATRRYAKQQRTWFNKLDAAVTWTDVLAPAQIGAMCAKLFS